MIIEYLTLSGFSLLDYIDNLYFIYCHSDLIQRCLERGQSNFEANLWELKSL
jgi:hypothetical protein